MNNYKPLAIIYDDEQFWIDIVRGKIGIDFRVLGAEDRMCFESLLRANENVNMIVLDTNLEDNIKGVDICRDLRRRREFHAVFIAGMSSNAVYRESYRSAGANDFFSKLDLLNVRTFDELLIQKYAEFLESIRNGHLIENV